MKETLPGFFSKVESYQAKRYDSDKVAQQGQGDNEEYENYFIDKAGFADINVDKAE